MREDDGNLRGFPENANKSSIDWLGGASEMAERIRSMDWSSTSLGGRAHWPLSLRTLLNLVVTSKIPMVVLWGSELITLYNDSCRDIFAEKHPGALGMRAPEVWPEAWHICEPIVAAVMGRGEAFDRKDVCFPLTRYGRNEEAYFSLADSPVYADDGHIGGMVTIFHETTAEVSRARQLKQAQDADRASRLKLEAAFASMADAICIVDNQGKLIDCNGAFCEIHNISREQALSMTVEEYAQSIEVYFPDGTLTPLEDWAVPRALRGETVMNAEYILRHKGSGESIFASFNFAPMRNERGEIAGAVVSGHDVTEQKRAAEALRASEAKYSAIFEKSPYALAIASQPGGAFTAVNDAFLRLFEFSRDEVIGKHSGELKMADEKAREQLRNEFVSRGGSLHDHECIRYSKFGHKRHVLMNLDWVRIAEQSHVLVTMQDISARKEAEEAKRLYQKTKELDELKTRFVANVSHEFRTPLALILGPAEQSMKDASISESAHQNLALIARNARTLLGYVNNLLDIAKLEAGRMNVECMPTDLAHLVRTAASHFEILAADQRFSFEVQAPDQLLAEIDAEKVQRIVMNLLSNAFKFTPAGGRVRVTVKEIPEQVHIEVADSGPGVAEDRREKLFERFGTGNAGATGLGLSIVREFTLLHGGTISLSDAPEGGALFAIQLPRKAQQDATVRPVDPESLENFGEKSAPHSVNQAGGQLPRPAERTTGPVVLVIEDNADMNAFIVASIADQYRVHTAFNGEDGLEKAQLLAPDLILCDLMMPGMTGEEFVHQARQFPLLQCTPIVILSAKADDELRVRLLREGVQDFITKPFFVEELRIRVGNLISKHLAERATQLAESKYRGIISSLADAIVTINAEHDIIEWNDGAEKIFGYTRAEVLGQPLAMLLPDRFRGVHTAHISHFAKEIHAARKMAHSKAIGRRKNGEEFPIAATISRFEVGGQPLLTAAIRDIYEEKRTEDELRTLAEFGTALASLDYEKTLQALVRVAVRSLGDFAMLLLFDNHDRLQTVATASRDPAKAHYMESLMGMPFEPKPAHPIWNIITTRRSTILNVPPEAYESVALTPERLEIIRAIEPKGVVTVPLLFGEHFLGVLTLASVSRKYDSRDLRILEEVGRQCALFVENARLHRAKRTAIRARDDVLGVVAHDLRNPLGVILIEAAMLEKMASPTTERIKRFAENIDRSARRMGRIIDDLLDVVHIEAGHLSMEWNYHSPNRIIADAVDTQKGLASRASIAIRSEVAPNLPEVYVDRDRILQVLENLLGNAIKFSQTGQTIIVGAKQTDSNVLVWVQDQGVGIAPDALPRVFDRFWHSDVRSGGGTGLGLAIVKGIVESHGGRVWAESTLGAGSTFYFTMRVVRRDTPPKVS